MVVSPARGIDPRALLGLLADAELRSAAWLAHELGVSRAAVLEGIQRLRSRGVELDAVSRRGYALKQRLELLDAAAILAEVPVPRRALVDALTVEFEVDSTNSRLLAVAPPSPGRAQVMLTEVQYAGRGRRGRPWIAPFGDSLALSLSWSFTEAAQASPALSLAVGVSVVRALTRCGATGVGLKWPNDLWYRDGKLGGVLTELRAEASGPAHVVIGVGVNVGLSPAARAGIEAVGTPAAAAADACAVAPSRNSLAGAIVDELLSMLLIYEREGFAAFRSAWTAFDALRDRPAWVQSGAQRLAGTARGVDTTGALRFETAAGLRVFVAGEVSLRRDGDPS